MFAVACFTVAAQNPKGHQELMSIEKFSPCFLGWEGGPGAFQGAVGHDFTNMTHDADQGEDGALVFDGLTHPTNHGPLYYQLSKSEDFECDPARGLVDISDNPEVSLRIKASSPVQIIVYVQEGNEISWNYSKFSLTHQAIDVTTEWQVVVIDSILSTNIAESDSIDLTRIGCVVFELGRTDGENFDTFDGTVSVDYIKLGSAVSCESIFVNDTSVVNYKDHEKTPKTIAFADSNILLSENGCDSIVRNFEYYCEEATRRDTNFVVTSNFSLSNYTQFELSQTIGQNRNGCDSLVYTYTSYVYCKPKETEQTILIKTVNSTIFDDQTELFTSSTYTTDEGCDSIHSIYKLYKYDPSSADTIYEIDTVYESGTDTVYEIWTDTLYQTDTVYESGTDTVYEINTVTVYQIDTVYESDTDTIYEMGTDTVFIKNTACDTLVIDLSDVSSAEYLSSEFNLKVYPNPASEMLYLDYTKPESFTDGLSFTVFDNTGRAVNQQALDENAIKSIDLSKMAAGTYLITIYDSSFNIVAQAPFIVNK